MNTLSEPPSSIPGTPFPSRHGAVLTHFQHPVFRLPTIVVGAAFELSRRTLPCPAA